MQNYKHTPPQLGMEALLPITHSEPVNSSSEEDKSDMLQSSPSTGDLLPPSPFAIPSAHLAASKGIKPKRKGPESLMPRRSAPTVRGSLTIPEVSNIQGRSHATTQDTAKDTNTLQSTHSSGPTTSGMPSWLSSVPSTSLNTSRQTARLAQTSSTHTDGDQSTQLANAETASSDQRQQGSGSPKQTRLRASADSSQRSPPKHSSGLQGPLVSSSLDTGGVSAQISNPFAHAFSTDDDDDDAQEAESSKPRQVHHHRHAAVHEGAVGSPKSHKSLGRNNSPTKSKEHATLLNVPHASSGGAAARYQSLTGSQKLTSSQSQGVVDEDMEADDDFQGSNEHEETVEETVELGDFEEEYEEDVAEGWTSETRSVVSLQGHEVEYHKLQEEMARLQAELSESKAVAAGLRGELRKYTQMTAQFEAHRKQHHLGALGRGAATSAGSFTGSEPPLVSMSSAAVNLQTANALASALSAALNAALDPSKESSPGLRTRASLPTPTTPAPSPKDTAETAPGTPVSPSANQPGSPAGSPGRIPVEHGLDLKTRRALYKEALSGCSALAAGTMLDNIMEGLKVLAEKDPLKEGDEKVILIYIQRALASGAQATRYLELSQKDMSTHSSNTTGASGRPASLSPSNPVPSIDTSNTVLAQPDTPSPTTALPPTLSIGSLTDESDQARDLNVKDAETAVGTSEEHAVRNTEHASNLQVEQLLEENKELRASHQQLVQELAVLRSQLVGSSLPSPFAASKKAISLPYESSVYRSGSTAAPGSPQSLAVAAKCISADTSLAAGLPVMGTPVVPTSTAAKHGDASSTSSMAVQHQNLADTRSADGANTHATVVAVQPLMSADAAGSSSNAEATIQQLLAELKATRTQLASTSKLMSSHATQIAMVSMQNHPEASGGKHGTSATSQDKGQASQTQSDKPPQIPRGPSHKRASSQDAVLSPLASPPPSPTLHVTAMSPPITRTERASSIGANRLAGLSRSTSLGPTQSSGPIPQQELVRLRLAGLLHTINHTEARLKASLRHQPSAPGGSPPISSSSSGGGGVAHDSKPTGIGSSVAVALGTNVSVTTTSQEEDYTALSLEVLSKKLEKRVRSFLQTWFTDKLKDRQQLLHQHSAPSGILSLSYPAPHVTGAPLPNKADKIPNSDPELAALGIFGPDSLYKQGPVTGLVAGVFPAARRSVPAALSDQYLGLKPGDKHIDTPRPGTMSGLTQVWGKPLLPANPDSVRFPARSVSSPAALQDFPPQLHLPPSFTEMFKRSAHGHSTAAAANQPGDTSSAAPAGDKGNINMTAVTATTTKGPQDETTSVYSSNTPQN